MDALAKYNDTWRRIIHSSYLDAGTSSIITPLVDLG